MWERFKLELASFLLQKYLIVPNKKLEQIKHLTCRQVCIFWTFMINYMGLSLNNWSPSTFHAQVTCCIHGINKISNNHCRKCKCFCPTVTFYSIKKSLVWKKMKECLFMKVKRLILLTQGKTKYLHSGFTKQILLLAGV